jgi:hypothetical protein
VHHYSAALSHLPGNAIILSNRALAYIKLENYVLAIQDATRAIEADPNYPKAYYRRGSAEFALGRTKAARRDFRTVCKLRPKDGDARAKLNECDSVIEGLAPPSPLPSRGASLCRNNLGGSIDNHPDFHDYGMNNGDGNEGGEGFIYTGREIQPDVTRVIVHPLVKVIRGKAFFRCSTLMTVVLGEGLEEIGKMAFRECASLRDIMIPNSVRVIQEEAFNWSMDLTTVNLGEGLMVIGTAAFGWCTSLQRIVIPPLVKTIKDQAFYHCSALTIVRLGEGLEVIGKGAFCMCSSFQHIVIPPFVKTIEDGAFNQCSGLTTVTLGDGLEKIGKEAFGNCTSLPRIMIPRAVKTIHEKAFKGCSNLTNVVFCDEIEEFVSAESMRGWWNHGVSEKALSTYCFLVRCSIPQRLSLVLIRKWQASVHGMLRRIPSIPTQGLNAYFHSIDSKLIFYENLKDAIALLELAIWKSKITEQLGQNSELLTAEMKMLCRIDSVSTATIILPNVLTFL